MAFSKVVFMKGLSLGKRSTPKALFFTNSWPLQKNNNQRLKVNVGGSSTAAAKATSRRESVIQMRAAAVRTKWEAERAKADRLKGIHPPANSSVYFKSSFETECIPFTEAVGQLREAAAPEIYDCLGNPLTAKILLNMRTKKLTKFISKLEATILLPHSLSFLPKRRIIALCTDQTDVDKCQALGSVLAIGGPDIVSRLETGGFHWDEYDDIVAHPDFTEALHRLRKTLRNRLPSTKNGRLTEDVAKTVAEQQECVLLDSVSVEGVPEITQLNLVLGQLSWSDQQLAENLISYLRIIETEKSSRIHGNTFDSVELECLPCDERILVDIKALLTDADKAQKEVVEPAIQTDTFECEA